MSIRYIMFAVTLGLADRSAWPCSSAACPTA